PGPEARMKLSEISLSGINIPPTNRPLMGLSITRAANRNTQMASGFSQDRLARIAPFLATRYVEPGLIPGALTLIWRRGAVAHLSLVGSIDLARGKPMREDAIFRIYSMTKPITSVALLMLLEEGKIALDDPVSRFIPGFAGLGVFAGGSDGAF